MANTYLTMTVIAKETLAILRNKMILGRLVDKTYAKYYEGNEPAQGSTITIPKAVEYVSGTGATAYTNIFNQQSTTFAVATQQNLVVNFPSADLTLSITDFAKKHLAGVGARFAQDIETAIANTATSMYNAVGTPGTPISSIAALGNLAAKCDKIGIPAGQRSLVLDPTDYWALAGGMTGIANIQNPRSENQITGEINNIFGFNIYASASLPTVTKGTLVTAAVGSNLGTYSGAAALNFLSTAGSLVVGDIFTISSVYSVNPQTKTSTGYLQQFVVTSAVATTAASVSVAISPAFNAGTISATLPYQNIDSLPGAGAAITVLGSNAAGYNGGMLITPHSIGLVSLPMVLPGGAAYKVREVLDNISLRIIQDYTMSSDVNGWRFDMLFGTSVVDPRTCMRVIS